MTKRSFLRAHSTRKRRGTAAAEFAVCLPIVALFVFATVEACLMINLKQSCTIAAYEGSREALLPGATQSDVIAEINQVLTDRDVQGGTPIVPANIDTLSVGSFIRVEVTAPCDQNTLLGSWYYSSRDVSGAAEVMKEF